jgi:hypothetical protein
MSNSNARMTFEGLEVCITRSAGADGTLVVFIDGPANDTDSNADGTPAIRVLLNDSDLYSGRAYAPKDDQDATSSSCRTGMRPMTITVELSEPQLGVYIATAISDDGDLVAVESGDSPYEAACDALATVTPSIDPTARS